MKNFVVVSGLEIYKICSALGWLRNYTLLPDDGKTNTEHTCTLCITDKTGCDYLYITEYVALYHQPIQKHTEKSSVIFSIYIVLSHAVEHEFMTHMPHIV